MRFLRRTSLSLTLVAASLALAAPVLAQSLERHPYLQRAASDQITVAWQTTSGTSSVVRYGSAPDALDERVEVAGSRTQHEVRITGLEPNTRYYYQVAYGADVPLAGGDEAHWFETYPAAGDPKKVRIWVLGDSGTGDLSQAAVRDAYVSWAGPTPADLILHVGDMAYNSGTTSEFTQNFFTPYRSILSHTVCWPSMGNHEWYSNPDPDDETGGYFVAYVPPKQGECGGVASNTEMYYSFDHGDIHFISLESDETPRGINGTMLNWLEADLDAVTSRPTPPRWILAFWHHPPYSKGSHNSDTETQMVEMRRNAVPVLQAYGVDAVFTGHSHIYERSYLIDATATYNTSSDSVSGNLDTFTVVGSGDGKPTGDGAYEKPAVLTPEAGTMFLVCGHGAKADGGSADYPAMYFSEKQRGSCVLDIHDNRLSLTNIRYDDVITDSFTLVKGDALVVLGPQNNERLLAGQPASVTWASYGTVGAEVKLEYSLDDGDTWQTIVASTENDGTHEWTLPETFSQAALVRVSEVGGELEDESDGAFQILPSNVVEEDAIASGDEWRWTTGGDPGGTWRELSFDDSSWSTGTTEIGYGDDDEATVIPGAQQDNPSYYFRKVITLDGTITEAELSVVFDDGVAVWINGQLVTVQDMGDGYDYAEWATGGTDDNQVATVPVPLDYFVVGENIITALVKQRGATSSDLSFDLTLSVVKRNVECGDFLVDAGEECDDGGESTTCNADCTTSICGDSKVNVTAGEECDQGEVSDTCSRRCAWREGAGGAGSTGGGSSTGSGSAGSTGGSGSAAGGSGQTGGVAGTSGDGSGAAASNNAGAGTSGSSTSDDAGGCSCRAAGTTTNTPPAAAWLALAAGALVLGRRRARARA